MINDNARISETINLLRSEGSSLRKEYPSPSAGMPPFTYACTLSENGVSPEDLEALPEKCPKDLLDFWNAVHSAHLFEDQVYGQWGLELLDPKQSAELTKRYRDDRQADYTAGDLVVGRFFGDSDLLMIRCDPVVKDYGAMIAVLPLYRRVDWDFIEESFSEFLHKYAVSGGEKYWL